MRLDQIAQRPGAVPARSAAADAAPRATPASDPLAQLARLIAEDETFTTIVRDNNRTERRVEFGSRRDQRPASGRAREVIPSHQEWDGDEGYRLVAPGIASGPSSESHDWYDDGDYDEADYADDPLPRRHWVSLFAAVFGLALLGSASAFAYWAFFDARASREQAQVADTSTAPQKVMPSPQQADGRSDEQVRAQSNVGGGGAAVSGEEKPADVQPAMTQTLPPVGFSSGGAPAQVAALTTGTAPPDSTVAAQDQPPPANDPAPNAAPVSAPEPGVGAASKYIVQLSSQRSEAAAQTTSRGLQTKYAELFGGLQPFIRRSDLRDRGVYYRVLIGPFAAFGEANQLCGSLKKSGGDCVVQKN